MRHTDDLSTGKARFSRRQVLVAGAVIMAGGLITSALPPFALAGTTNSFTPFMQISRLLVNHQLDEAVGQRMLTLLAAEEADLLENINQLLAIARTANATVVEEFFSAIPAGKLQDLAYKIIFGWYTGSLEPGRSAKTFAFEQALTWYTTQDAIAIPSYGFSGPNKWQRSNKPILPLPQF